MSERDSSAACAAMVARLQREGLLQSPALIDAFAAIRREWFLPGVDPATVYGIDTVVPTVFDADGTPVSSSSAPRIMARMLERLDAKAGDRVLEIGTGTGYNAGLLAHVVGETGSVTTVDIDDDIVDRARQSLETVGLGRVRCVAADGWLGVADAAPFDRIIATVGIADIAPNWIALLGADGVLVVPLWLRGGLQAVAALRHDADGLVADHLEACGFMRLRGPHASSERYRKCGPWGISLDAGATDSDAPRIEQLLVGPSTPFDVPALLRGWFTALTLSHADAIQLTAFPRWAVGLFDPTGDALALVTGDQNGSEPLGRLHGNVDRARQLAEEMLSVRPVSLSSLRLRVISREVDIADGTWTLRRHDHTLVLSADPNVAPERRPAVGWE